MTIIIILILIFHKLIFFAIYYLIDSIIKFFFYCFEITLGLVKFFLELTIQILVMSLLTPFFLFYFTFGGYFLFYYQISYGWNKGCEYFMEKIKNLTTTKKLNKFEKYFKKNNKVEVKRNKKPNNALFSFALYFMLLSSHSFFLLLFFK